MKLNTEPFRSWFGFSRRERRSASILVILIFIVILVRYSFPENSIELEELSASMINMEMPGRISNPDHHDSIHVFYFDPNTASFDTLKTLGLDDKEARTLISYRRKGGQFRKPSDLKKVYGIREPIAETLMSYIVVKQDTSNRSVKSSSRIQRLPIDINHSDSALLVSLPGIGPVLSARIIKYRHLIGGYASVEQLKDVYGLSSETYEMIRERVFADSSDVNRINVNSADYKELSRVPYIDRYEVTAILKYRELKGRLDGIDDIVDNKLIIEEKALKMLPYLRFE